MGWREFRAYLKMIHQIDADAREDSETSDDGGSAAEATASGKVVAIHPPSAAELRLLPRADPTPELTE